MCSSDLVGVPSNAAARWTWGQARRELAGAARCPHLGGMNTEPLRFDNRFIQDLPGDEETGPRVRDVRGAVWSAVMPTPVAAPTLLAYSPELAAQLGWGPDLLESADFARVFGGNALYEGMQPWAANYGGHQFGRASCRERV